MLNTVVNPMLNTLAGGGNKGNQLIQLGGSFNSISATIVPVLVGYLIGDLAQAKISNADPALFLAMGIFALAFVVLYFVNIPEPHIVKTSAKKEKSKHSALSFRHFVLGTVAIFIYVGVEVGIPNFANLFMTSHRSNDCRIGCRDILVLDDDRSFVRGLYRSEGVQSRDVDGCIDSGYRVGIGCDILCR